MTDNPFEPGTEKMEPNVPMETAVQQPEFDEYKLKRFMKRLKEEQNLPLGVAAGIGAAVLGAVIWAAITVITDYQIGWMAIGVGFLVGLGIRYFGKGLDKVFGFAGAGLSLVGCLMGNFLAANVIISQIEGVPFLDVLIFFLTTPAAAIELMTIAFSPIDLLFYGIAVYQGYKLSFRRVTEDELQAAMSSPI